MFLNTGSLCMLYAITRKENLAARITSRLSPTQPNYRSIFLSPHLGLLRISLQEGLQCHPQILFHIPPQKKKNPRTWYQVSVGARTQVRHGQSTYRRHMFSHSYSCVMAYHNFGKRRKVAVLPAVGLNRAPARESFLRKEKWTRDPIVHTLPQLNNLQKTT